MDRKQQVVFKGMFGSWQQVNKDTTQCSVSGPHLFNIFNDLTISNNSHIVKYADDTTLLSPINKFNHDNTIDIVDQYMNWSIQNCMPCYVMKCKEFILKKKEIVQLFQAL